MYKNDIYFHLYKSIIQKFNKINTADDWECEHEKLAESVGPRPPIIPHKVANIIQPSHNNPELQEPLHFLKYPLTDYNSLKTPACFPPPPNINRHSHSNHFLEDEAELAIHEVNDIFCTFILFI